jgi:hypothetical protein
MKLLLLGSVLVTGNAAGWTKITEGPNEDGLGYCAVPEHHESHQAKNYVGSTSNNLFATGCGGTCTMAHVAEARDTCATRCDTETNFACVMYSIGISNNKQTVFCVGSSHMPTMTTTKQDAECWTNHDSPHNCQNWDCPSWCSLYDENFTPQYEAAGCADDGEECNCADDREESGPAPIISPNQPAHWGSDVATSEPSQWGSCPNGNEHLAIYECPANAGKKCWSGKKRGYFNNGNTETNSKGQCQECPAIDGCQLNRPLHKSLGGGPNFCTCHTCFGKYEDCPEGESCAFTNEITGETSQRYVDRFLTNDRSQCTLCSTDVDDHCSMWDTHYGQKGQEACICRTCYKGWGVNLEGTCVQYMTKDVTATGEIDNSSWRAVPKYQQIPNIWLTTAADLSRIG